MKTVWFTYQQELHYLYNIMIHVLNFFLQETLLNAGNLVFLYSRSNFNLF